MAYARGMDAGDTRDREAAPDEASRAYFEHGADIGVIGRGPSLERAFAAAAEATFAIMRDPLPPGGGLRAEVAFEEDDLELALVRWLNALLAAAHEQNAVYGRFALERHGTHWRGSAWGEAWRPEQPRGTEVKGATLTALAVSQGPAGWEARCVVDV